jgi:hypothetical protein
LNAYQNDFVIIERLAAIDRSNSFLQRNLAFAHSKLATTFEKQARIPAALAELKKGREIIVALLAIAPNRLQWKNDLAWFDRQIARLEGHSQGRDAKQLPQRLRDLRVRSGERQMPDFPVGPREQLVLQHLF